MPFSPTLSLSFSTCVGVCVCVQSSRSRQILANFNHAVDGAELCWFFSLVSHTSMRFFISFSAIHAFPSPYSPAMLWTAGEARAVTQPPAPPVLPDIFNYPACTYIGGGLLFFFVVVVFYLHSPLVHSIPSSQWWSSSYISLVYFAFILFTPDCIWNITHTCVRL